MTEKTCQELQEGEAYSTEFYTFASSLTITYFTYIVSVNISYYQSNFGDIIESYTYLSEADYDTLKNDNKRILRNSLCLNTAFYIFSLIIFYKLLKKYPRFISNFGNSYSKINIKECIKKKKNKDNK
jgi:hypothetical protein